MDRSIEKFDKLLSKTHQGYSFTRSQRSLKIPNSQQFINDCNLEYHYASNTQKIYSPFQHTYYNPPHLNSSKTYGLLHRGECKAWKVCSNNANIQQNSNKLNRNKENNKKWIIQNHHTQNKTTTYDSQYRIYEERTKKLPKRRYPQIHSRIKYVVDQDRPSKPSKLYNAQDEQQEEE